MRSVEQVGSTLPAGPGAACTACSMIQEPGLLPITVSLVRGFFDPRKLRSARQSARDAHGSRETARQQWFESLLHGAEISYPDISKTDRLTAIAVRLQLDGRTVVRLIERLPDIQRLAF